MSPILVRPVREQLEHDRVIRLLQAKYKRKFDVAINPGHEQTASVGNPESPWYPDLVLYTEPGRKLAGVIEVETAESVNNLEAMSQWVTFSRLRAQFHLYVPTSYVDSTRRLCHDLQVSVAELWAYQAVGDQIRFALIERSAQAEKARAAEAAEPKPKAAVRPAGRATPARPAAKAVKSASPKAAATKAVAAKPPAKPPASKAKTSATGSRAAASRSRTARPAVASRTPARRPATGGAARRTTAKAAAPAARRKAKTPARKAAGARSQKRR